MGGVGPSQSYENTPERETPGRQKIPLEPLDGREE